MCILPSDDNLGQHYGDHIIHKVYGVAMSRYVSLLYGVQ
jgi:hypothetical protein